MIIENMIIKTIFWMCFVVALFHILYGWYITEISDKTRFTLVNPFTLDDCKTPNLIARYSYIIFTLLCIFIMVVASMCIIPLMLVLLCLFALGYAFLFTFIITICVILPYTYVADLFSPGVFEMVINDIKGIF